MKKADLHVHSRYSNHPSFWFLQRLGAGESYTEPEFIYQCAKEKGMDYITITDHNRIAGALELKARHPEEVIVGVETTTYFPEDGCKIHVLVYNLDEADFQIIQNVREDIYEFRDFLKESGLSHSVAHATYSVNDKLTQEHIEKLILLFDIFEGINGGRNRKNNQIRMKFLNRLTPDYIQKIFEKHRIEPFSDNPWLKGFTGGSDDHAGLFIGETYTVAEAHSIPEFLNRIMAKSSYIYGRHNNYQSLAFTIYKIATDFIQNSSKNLPDSFINILNNKLFNPGYSLKDKIESLKLKFAKRKSKRYSKLINTIEQIESTPSINNDQKFDLIYDSLSYITDDIIKRFSGKISELSYSKNIGDVFSQISTFLPGIFLSVPFFTSLKYTYNSHHLINQMERKCSKPKKLEDKKVLWFTDTLYDLNGVSVTLQKIADIANNENLRLNVVTIGNGSTKKFENVINLPVIDEFTLPYYKKYKIKIPSLLKSIKIIDQFDPDNIIISTPATTGLFALLAGKLMNIKTTGIYHTDFKSQSLYITGDEGLANTVESYINWFYSQLDEIRVPTNEYINLLIKRGFKRDRVKLFRRGIDINQFSPEKEDRSLIINKYDVLAGINMVYTGRVSKDKNLDFLVQVYKELIKSFDNLNLMIIGDGPYYEEFSRKTEEYNDIFLIGRLDRSALPEIYASSDLLLFPSTTDTFGMTVLEAQACGLPSLVSNVGGPQEIVDDGNTGFILEVDSIKPWVDTIAKLIREIKNNTKYYRKLRANSRDIVGSSYDWQEVLKDLLLEQNEMEHREPELLKSPLVKENFKINS